jgi:hypothetical protein
MESCQGGEEQYPWVCFKYGNTYKELSEFVFSYFGLELMRLLGDRVNIYIRVTENGNIRAELSICPDSLHKTVRAVKLLAHGFSKIYRP